MIKDIRSQTPKRSQKRPVSSVTHICRHHSATTVGDFWTFWNGRWKGLGWITGGYHEIILRDGTVELCYDPDMHTNGVGGHNMYTYHICLVGNGSFTDAQEKAWDERARYNMKRLNIPVNRVLGHREFPGQSTACPGINMNTVRNRLKSKEEPDLIETIIVYNSNDDKPAVDPLARRLNCGEMARRIALKQKGKIAKKIFVVGGSKDGLEDKADEIEVLSGANRFRTYREVEKYLER